MDRHEYLGILEEQIRTKRARAMIVEELEAHIEDQKSAFMAEGMTASEAEERAVREMGDPVETGVALDRIHRPRMEWGVFAGVVLISLMGLVLQIIVVMTAHPTGSAGRLKVILNDGIGRHMVIMAAGILLMLFICWIDYSFIGKHAVFLWLFVNGLFLLCIFTGPVINGRPAYVVQVSSLMVPFYAGIIYHFRGQGQKGLVKSGACLCLSLALMVYGCLLSHILVTGIVGLILLHAAIYKRWFGTERRKLYMKLWLSVGALAVLCAAFAIVRRGERLLAGYQIERIRAWLYPGRYEEYYYMPSAVTQAAEAVKEGASYATGNIIDIIRNDYLWLYLFHYLGTWRGILLTLLVVCFWGLLFRTVHRQKNRLGYMVSLGCVLFLSLQTVVYIGMNFGYLPSGSWYLPFLSNGGSFLLISYFYMGILLSVCRNAAVVRN